MPSASALEASPELIGSFGSFGSGDGQLTHPKGVATDSAGNIYVVDSGNNRIQKFDSDGDYLDQWSGADFDIDQPDSMYSIATSPDDSKFYITDTLNHRVQIIGEPKESEDISDTTDPGADNQSVISNAEDGQIVVVKSPEGTTLTCSQSVKYDSLPVKDLYHSYPLGFTEFCFDSSQVDNRVSVVYVTDLASDQVKPRKYIPEDNNYNDLPPDSDYTVTPGLYEGRSALVLSYVVKDNGELDIDKELGKIRDPVGLSVVDSPSLINTGMATILTTFVAMIIILLAVFTYLDYRRHKRPLVDMDKEMNTNISKQYTYWHHVRLVTVPLAKYRLSIRLERSSRKKPRSKKAKNTSK